MGIQGLNLKVDITRMNYANDDDVGGSTYTGTTVYSDFPASIFARRPSQISLEQGLEVEAIYDMTMRLCDVTLIERDLVEVTCPSNHPYYGLQFRILGVQPGKRIRGAHQHVTLSRIRKSRRQQ